MGRGVANLRLKLGPSPFPSSPTVPSVTSCLSLIPTPRQPPRSAFWNPVIFIVLFSSADKTAQICAERPELCPG